MTDEEALKILKNTLFSHSELCEAVQVAIKSLEKDIKQESLMAGVKALEQEPCDDCISREAALDDAGLGEFHRYDDYVKMRNYLKSLPPVTPLLKIENAPLSMIKSIREKEDK